MQRAAIKGHVTRVLNGAAADSRRADAAVHPQLPWVSTLKIRQARNEILAFSRGGNGLTVAVDVRNSLRNDTLIGNNGLPAYINIAN